MRQDISDTTLGVERKRALRDLERQYAFDDRCEFEQLLEVAFQKSGDDEALRSILTWFEVLSPLGCHPTFIAQAWTGWQYRQGHAPRLAP
jgi:hypothetical protein